MQGGGNGSRASVSQALLAPDAHSLTLSHLHKASNSLMRRLKLREAKSLPEVMQSEAQLRLDPRSPGGRRLRTYRGKRCRRGCRGQGGGGVSVGDETARACRSQIPKGLKNQA